MNKLCYYGNGNKYLPAFGFSDFLCVPFPLSGLDVIIVCPTLKMTPWVTRLYQSLPSHNILWPHHGQNLVACLSSVIFLIFSVTVDPLYTFVCWCGWQPEVDPGCLPLSFSVLFLWDGVFLQTETVTAVGLYRTSSFNPVTMSLSTFSHWFFDVR